MALTAGRVWRVQAAVSRGFPFMISRPNLCPVCQGCSALSTHFGEQHTRIRNETKTEKPGIFPNGTNFSGFDKCLKSAKSVKEILHAYETSQEDLTPTDKVKSLFRMARVFSKLELEGKKRNCYTTKSLNCLLGDIRRSSSSYNHRQLADIVWSLAKLGVADRRQFGLYEKEISQRDPSLFSNVDMAMILWGYGKMQMNAPYLYTAMRREVMSRDLSSFRLFELCQIVWSFVRTMEQSAKLFALIKDEIMKRDDFKKLNNKGLVMLLWAYAESQLNVASLFQVLKREILHRQVSSFNQEQLSQIVWSFANQGMRVPALFDKVEEWITASGTVVLDKQGLVMVCWAFAKTNNSSEKVFQHVEERLMKMELTKFSAPQQIRLLWSFVRSCRLKKRLLVRLSEALILQDFSELPHGPLEELVDSLKNCPLAAPNLVSLTEQELIRRSKSGQQTV